MSTNAIETNTIPGPANAAAAPPRSKLRHWLFGRRRQLLVNRRFQYRSMLLSVYTAFLPLVAFNVLGYFHSRTVTTLTATAAPHLKEQIMMQQRATLLSYLGFTVLFIIGIGWLKLLESHRTAGPAYRLSRSLEHVRDGRYDLTVSLRKTDYLGEVADKFNEALQTIRHREALEIAELNEIVRSLETTAPRAALRLAYLSDQKQARLI